jgi:uncharacterized protein (DUF1697 family)
MTGHVHIALVRGINVGGKSLPMKTFAAILEGLGCRRVKTYIQSGNAVFETTEQDRPRLAAQIAAEIERQVGFAPHVLVLSPDEIEQAIAQNPFSDAEADPSHLHLSFLTSPPPDADLARMETLRTATERFRLVGRILYLHAPDGFGRSKLAASIERLLRASTTDRNWTTVLKLRDMARELLGT